ncbi:MAG: BrnA antitoxin family protein [Treponema sp.]|jgi:uncharacterized protein (DUF4415 family)|nr:BrnA antitoxin family protein [Treponema sp.]
MKITGNKHPVMTDRRIAELQDFETKDFSDCPAQTPEQLTEFKPKYPDDRLYRPVKKIVQIRLDADVLEWLKQAGPGYQTRANAILRQAMLHGAVMSPGRRTGGTAGNTATPMAATQVMAGIMTLRHQKTAKRLQREISSPISFLTERGIPCSVSLMGFFIKIHLVKSHYAIHPYCPYSV